jgi:ubiquinone/menaquinone biosynthesis C-methylase UbiE
MLENGRAYFPQVRFEVQDFFQFSYQDDSFCGVVGFYAIVNLESDEIKALLAEVKRVLKPGGLFLFSFHLFEGEDKIEVDEFLDQKIDNLTFYFFKADDVKALVEETGFQVLDILIRYPYEDVEYPSKRAYFVVKKP